jgi:anti-sigma regulatory factor (Ser/Thr protein kinase)
MPSWNTEIEVNADGPAEARWFLWSAVASNWLPEQIETATLLVSEVVSNAVRHGDHAAPIDLSVALEGDAVRVAVRNHGPRFDPEVAVRQGDRFGLRLVSRLADHWGARPTETGMEVWFRV